MNRLQQTGKKGHAEELSTSASSPLLRSTIGSSLEALLNSLEYDKMAVIPCAIPYTCRRYAAIAIAD